jgi:hypothetical protein
MSPFYNIPQNLLPAASGLPSLIMATTSSSSTSLDEFYYEAMTFEHLPKVFLIVRMPIPISNKFLLLLIACVRCLQGSSFYGQHFRERLTCLHQQLFERGCFVVKRRKPTTSASTTSLPSPPLLESVFIEDYEHALLSEDGKDYEVVGYMISHATKLKMLPMTEEYRQKLSVDSLEQEVYVIDDVVIQKDYRL